MDRRRDARRLHGARRRDDAAAAGPRGAARRGRLEAGRRCCRSTTRSPPTISRPARAPAGVEVRPGDVLLVRTGYATCWNDEATYLDAAGVAKSGTLWAAEQGVVAVGADNMAWDVADERDPDTDMTLFGHVHLL